MKHIFLCAAFIFMIASTAICQRRNHQWNPDSVSYFTKDSIHKKGFDLVFINRDSSFSNETKKRLIDAFFEVYPKEVKKYNKNSAKKVTFIIDPSYKGVAATSRAVVRFNPGWFVSHPEDIDVVTHEAMHVVQSYHFGNVPGWLTEGIADYVRYEFGVNNKAGNWTLPDYNPKQSYENSYRITARFLIWIQKHKNKKIVVELDKNMREGTYSDDLWKELTGNTLDELWREYGKNPELKLSYK